MEILSVNSSDISEIADMQVIADRRMDVVMGHAETYQSDISQKEEASNAKIWRKYFNIMSQLIRPDPFYQGLKAEEEGKIIGCIFTGTDTQSEKKLTGFVEALFVHPDHWGQGVAKSLMCHALGELKNRNAREWAPMKINSRESSVVLFERRL